MMERRVFIVSLIFISLLGLIGCGTQKAPEPNEHATKTQVQPPKVRIVLDAGHGGESIGAVGVGGLQEKEVTLAVALLLGEFLSTRLGTEVVFTRTNDSSIALEERTRIANEAQGTVFISLHTNASPNKRRRGVEVYYLDNTNDESSIRLAARENGHPITQEDQDLGFILSDVVQNAKLDESITLAHYVYESLLSRLGRSYTRVKGNGVLKAPFSVLVGAHMPSILVEVSYIDEAVEGKRLSSPGYRRAVAEGIYSGILRFLMKQGNWR